MKPENKWTKEDEKNIDALYSLYQLDWMASHGHTLEEMMSKIANLSLLSEAGFSGGEIWACKDEFIDCELRDTSYMKSLIKNASNTKLEKWFNEFQNTLKRAANKAPAGR